MEEKDPGSCLVAAADAFAALAHAGQTRKDLVTPYISHPRAVMKILRDEFGISDPEILAAALLHDVLEDTDARLEELILRFGERVAGLVVLLTKDNSLPRSERDRVYFARLEAGPLEARICKIADSLHNFRDSDEKLRPKAFRKAKDLFLLFWDTPELNAELRILARELFG